MIGLGIAILIVWAYCAWCRRHPDVEHLRGRNVNPLSKLDAADRREIHAVPTLTALWWLVRTMFGRA